MQIGLAAGQTPVNPFAPIDFPRNDSFRVTKIFSISVATEESERVQFNKCTVVSIQIQEMNVVTKSVYFQKLF